MGVKFSLLKFWNQQTYNSHFNVNNSIRSTHVYRVFYNPTTSHYTTHHNIKPFQHPIHTDLLKTLSLQLRSLVNYYTAVTRKNLTSKVSFSRWLWQCKLCRVLTVCEANGGRIHIVDD